MYIFIVFLLGALLGMFEMGERHMIFYFLCVILLNPLVFSESADIPLRSCGFYRDATGTVFDIYTQTAFAIGDTITFENFDVFASVGVCTVDLTAASSFSLSTVSPSLGIRLTCTQPHLSSFVFTVKCTTSFASSANIFPSANGVACIASAGLTMSLNPIIGDSDLFTFSLRSLSLPAIESASSSKIVFKHGTTKSAFMDGTIAVQACSCSKDGEIPAVVGSMSRDGGDLVLTVNTPITLPYTCMCQNNVLDYWGYQSFYVQIAAPGGQVLYQSGPNQYLPPSSYPASRLAADTVTYPPNYDVFRDGLPQLVFNVLDANGKPVYSNGVAHVDLFPATETSLPHTPQIISSHKLTVRLNFAGKYTIPAGLARLAGYTTTTPTQIVAMLLPGSGFRILPDTIISTTVSLPHLSKPQPLWASSLGWRAYASVQRVQTYYNPGYQRQMSMAVVEVLPYSSALGQYTPTLYLPQANPLPIRGIGQYQSSGTPRPRLLAAEAKSVNQRRVYTVGGQVLQSSRQADKRRADAVLMDVWVYDVVAGSYELLSGNQHTLGVPALGGYLGEFDHAFHPAARHSAAAAVDVDERYLYVHGGCADVQCTQIFADLWVFDIKERMWATMSGANMPRTKLDDCYLWSETPLFGHQMVTPGLDVSTDPSRVNDVNLGLAPTDKLFIFGGATFTPTNHVFSDTGPYFASNALYEYNVSIDRTTTPPTFKSTSAAIISGVVCSTTLRPSQGSYRRLTGLTLPLALGTTWLPPAAVYAGMTYDPYRQVIWLYGGMHASYAFDANKPVTHDSPVRGRRETGSVPLLGNRSYSHFALGDSGALSWLWKFDIVSLKWVLMATTENHSPPLGRGAPRLAFRTDTQSVYNHPGGRVLPAITVEPERVYISGGLGHTLGAVLPAYPGVLDAVLGIIQAPSTRNNMFPLSLGLPPNVDPNTSGVFTLYTHMYYSANMLELSGLLPGMGLHGVEVLVRMNEQHTPVDSTDLIYTAVILRSVSSTTTMTQLDMRNIAADVDLYNMLAYKQLVAGEWVSVGVHRGDKGASWNGAFLSVTIVQRFQNPQPFRANAGPASGAEMRDYVGATAFSCYYNGEFAGASLTHNSIPTIMLRSQLMPVYNPLRMALPLTYSTYNPNLDDMWMLDISSYVYKEPVPPSANGVNPLWVLLSGHIISSEPQHPTLHPMVSTLTDLPKLTSLVMGPRAGAVLLAPRGFKATINTGEFLYNVFLKGGFQVHADRNQYFPDSTEVPRLPLSEHVLPVSTDVLPMPELTAYDDVWSMHFADKCLHTQFAYTCLCASEGVHSTLPFSTLLSAPKASACVDVCSSHSCGNGMCVNAAGRAQCMCDMPLGASYASTDDDFDILCDILQEDILTDHRLVWTTALPKYKTTYPASPGARFGAVVTTDNSGCVWLYGGVSNEAFYFRDLWRHCPANDQWTLVWEPATSPAAVQLGNPADLISPRAHEARPIVMGQEGEPGFAVKGTLFFASRGATHAVTGRKIYDEDSLFLHATSPFQAPTVWEYKQSTGKWYLRYRYQGLNFPLSQFNLPANVGSEGGFSSSASPAVREGAAIAIHDGNMYMFSGGLLLASGLNMRGHHLDLWVYNTTLHQWSLVWGRPTPTKLDYDNAVMGPSISARSLIARAGEMGKFAVRNSPGCRVGAAAAMSPDGRFFYLHGGARPSSQAQLLFTGFNSGVATDMKNAQLGYYGMEVLGDLWVFDTVIKQWAWLGGSLEPLFPGGHAGVYASPAQHDLNTPPPRFLHSMAIGIDGYLRLDRGATLRHVPNVGIWSELLRPLNDMFMLYLPPLTAATQNMVGDALVQQGLAASLESALKLPGTVQHVVGDAPKWILILGDKTSTQLPPTENQDSFGRGLPGTSFIMEPVFGHTLLLVPAPILIERALADKQLRANQVALLRAEFARQISRQFTVSVGGTSLADSPPSVPAGPFVSVSLLRSSKAFSYWWGAPCDYTICLNGGQCETPSGGQLFLDEAYVKCKCPPNVFGSACEYTYCDLYQCKNGGTCTITRTSTNTDTPCDCPDGYTGKFCDIETFIVTPIVDVQSGATLGPGYHLMAATTHVRVLPRLVSLLLLPPSTRAYVVSGGYIPTGSQRYSLYNNGLAVSGGTWLYSESTNTMVDLMQLVAERFGTPYNKANQNIRPQPAADAPWGICNNCAHFGARAGHSIAFFTDSAFSPTANPVVDGLPPPHDFLVVFGGAVTSSAMLSPLRTAYCNQLWEVNLGTGKARLVSGIHPINYDAVQASTTMTPKNYNPAMTKPRHESGEKEYLGKHPSVRAHHASQLLANDGRTWLYVFGGIGGDIPGDVGFLGDLWRLDMMRSLPAAGQTDVYEPNPNFLKWQYIGCSVSRHGYVFDPENLSPGTPLDIASVTSAGGCPSARAHASLSADARGRLWLVGGVGVRGPLDDVWVYDPAMGALGAWYMIQGTSHSGQNPASLTAAYAQGKLLWYVSALASGSADASSSFGTTSFTATATYPELGRDCSMGIPCPLVSTHTRAMFKNKDDAALYAPDHTRIGALVGAATVSTGSRMVLYGGLTRTRTYIPLYDKPSTGVLAHTSAVKMPFKGDTPRGRFYFMYTASDLTSVGLKADNVITQLAFALDTPLSGTHTISLALLATQTSTLKTDMDSTPLSTVAHVSPSTSHASGGYLTLSGLSLVVPTVSDLETLLLIIEVDTIVAPIHTTVLSCAPLASSTTSTIAESFVGPDATTLLPQGRVIVSHKDTTSEAFIGHMFIACAPALRISTRNIADMSPSNLLWHIDTAQPTDKLADTTITLISGALPNAQRRARYRFHSNAEFKAGGPSGPNDPIGAISYAYTHGLHAAVSEVCHDWLRRSNMVPPKFMSDVLGASALLHSQAGYSLQFVQNIGIPTDGALFTPLYSYPSAIAFGALFLSSADAVYLFGGVSTLQRIDSNLAITPDNTFSSSSTQAIYPRFALDSGSPQIFASPHIYSFGKPVPPTPFISPRPMLLTVSFATDFATILLDFDQDTAVPTAETVYAAAACARVLDAASLALVTTSSKCAWASRRRFSVLLHESHMVQQTSQLGIRAFTVFSIDRLFAAPATTRTVEMQASSFVVAVVAPVKESLPCHPLLISTAGSSGAYGRRLLHKWKLLAHPTEDNSAQIAAFQEVLDRAADSVCTANYPGHTGICVSELKLNAATAAAILLPGHTNTFELVVRNRFGDEATTSVTIMRADDPAPTVTVERFQYRKEFSAPLLLAATVTASRCALAPTIVRRSLGIAWTLESGTHPVNFTDANEVVLNGYNLVMVPYGLLPGTYTFTATVTETHYNALGMTRRLPTTTAPITVDIFTTAPTATLTGAVDRTVSLRYLRSGILARDLAVPNVVYTDTNGTGDDPTQPQAVVTLSAATSVDPAANPATSSPLQTLQFTWECRLSNGTTCFFGLTTSDGSLATLLPSTHTLRIAATTLDALSEALAEDDYLIFSLTIIRKIDSVTAKATSWLRIDRTTDISVSLSLSSPHTTTSAALIHSQPHDMVVSAALSSSAAAAEDPDAVVPVLRWYSDPPLNFTDIAIDLSRPAHASDLIIPSSRLLPNTRYTFYVHLFDVADAPPADAYLDANGVPASTSTAFATTSLTVFVQDFPALGECELTTLGPYAPMASMDLQTLNSTTCESGLCRLRASCRDWPEDSVFEWLMQTGNCANQAYTTASGSASAASTRGRSRGFGHRGVSSITDVHDTPRSSRTSIHAIAAVAGDRCEDMVQIAPGTAASAIQFVASIDTPAHLLVRVSLYKAVRYVSLPLPAPADGAVKDTAAVLAHVASVLDEIEFGPDEDEDDTSSSNSQVGPLASLYSVPQRVGRVRTNGVLGGGATATVSAAAEVSAEQLQVLLSGANIINSLLEKLPRTSSHATTSLEAVTAACGDDAMVCVCADADVGIAAAGAPPHPPAHTRADLLLLQQRVLRVLTSNATNLATYGAMSPTHSTAQDLINSASSSSSVVSEATLRAIAAPCTNPTTAYARVHCTDALVRAFSAYSARNIQEGVPTEVADSVLQRLAAIYDDFNATTLALSPARVLKPYTLADYAIDPTSLSATPQRTTPLPADGSVTEEDAALQRAHWEAVRISQQLLAAAKTAAFGDVALRQPESPPRLLVSDSISVLVDAQYVSDAPTSIAIGNDFRVTLPTNLASMLAEPTADPLVIPSLDRTSSAGVSPYKTTNQSQRSTVVLDDEDEDMNGNIASSLAAHERMRSVLSNRVPHYKQQLCASRDNASQTLRNVLSAYCGDITGEDESSADVSVLTTTVGGVTATRTVDRSRDEALAFARHAARNKPSVRSLSRAFARVQTAGAPIDGLVPVALKGTTMTKTLTSIISTAPALMRLVSADNRNDTHVASSSVVDVTMYNHTDAGRRDMSVDVAGIAQVQPLQWKPAPSTGAHTAAAAGTSGATVSTLADTSPSHFYFTFALPELAAARWSKLKKKPVPRCQFFMPTTLTDGVTAAPDDGTDTDSGTSDGAAGNTTLSAPTVGEWATEGCELVSVTATHATCRCSHLTYFRISFSLDDLFPSINLLSWDDFANLTWANLMKYPAPLITCLVWLGALCLLVAVAWVLDIHYDKRGLVELAEQWNKVMIASTDLSYVPSRAVVLDYKRYGLPQSPKDFDMCEYMLMSQYDQLGQWYVDVDALSMDQRQRKAAMKARAATVRANDAHAIAAAKAAVAAVNEEMRIEEGNEEEEDDEVAMYEDAAAAEVTEVMVVLPEQFEDTHSDTTPAVDVAEVDVGVSAPVPAIPEDDEDAADEQKQQIEEPVIPPLPVEVEETPLEPVAEDEPIYPATEDVDEDDEEYDVVDDDVFDAMYPNTETAPDTPAEAPAAMVVETMSEDDMLIHSTAFDAPAAPRRPGRLTISRSAYNERMKAKAKAKPPAQHALHQNRLFAAPYYAGAIVAPSATSTFNANDADADTTATGTDGPLANPPPPPAHAQPARGSVADLRRPTMSYPAASSTTSKRASVSNAAYPGATSTTGRRSIATVPYAAAGLADEGSPVFVTMSSVEPGMDVPYAKDAGRGSMSVPPAFFPTKSVDTTTKAANRRASVVPPRPSLFSRPAFARPLTLRASVVAPESKAAVAASTRATFPLLTLPPPRPPAGQSDWREVGSTFGDKMKSDHPLITLFTRSPTDDITFTGHVVILMLMVLSGLAISAFFTQNDEHEIIKDFIVGLITACLLMPVMVVLRYAIVENNHQRLVGFLQWYAELCCFLRYEQVKLLHLGLEAAVPFGDGDEELVSMIKMAIRKQRIEERERKEKDQRQQHSAVDAEAGVEMTSMATGSNATGTGNAAGRGDVEASADASGKEDASGDESDADSEVSTFTPAHTRCECCNSTISCSFNALPPMYRLQLLPHSAYEQIATVAQLGEAALQRVPCRGEVEMREEQLLNELALLGAWDDLLAARAQDKKSVRVAVNKVQWREWLRWAEDTAVALGGDDDADDAITATFNTANNNTASASTTTKPKHPAHAEEDEESSLLYNKEEAAYRAELLHSRVDWTRSIGLSSGDADDETDVSDVVWIDTGVTPVVDATATALAITAAAAKTRKTRKTTVPAPTSTTTADMSLGRSIAASLCPAPALGWGIAPGLGGVPNENESVTVDTTFTMQHLPALDEQAAQHYGNASATSTYNYANGPASPRASDATVPASPRSSNATAVAAVPVIGGSATPGSPRVSSATVAGAPRGSPSVSRANSTVVAKASNPMLSLLHDPLPQLPVAVTAQRHNHIPSSAAVPLSPLPPPNPLVGPGPSLVQTSATARAQLLAALRQHTRIHIPHLLRFYDAYMPVMPRSVKGKLSVAFLVFWTLLCGFLVVAYGLQFDLAAVEAGDAGNDFDFGKDAGEAESAGEWILNGLFGVALELVIYAPILLLMDACVEARVQKKRERERAAWEYEQAAAIFNDTLQPSDDAGDAEDADINLHATSGDAGAGCDEVEMVDMRTNTRATKGDFDDAGEPVLATYPLASPVAPPLPLPALTTASSSASASAEALTTPTHTSSAPCSPVPTSTLPRAASSSPPTNQARRRTSSAAAGPSRSMERYHSLTERPDLTSADQRLMAVLQRMQIDFAPHRFFAAAALEYPLESAFPILGHMRADTFLRLCANKMKWSAASGNGTGVHHPKGQASHDTAAAEGKHVDGSAAPNTAAPAAGAAKVAPVVARVDNDGGLNISGVSWLNDKHSKRHQRKKQSDARRSKVSVAVDGTTDSSVSPAAGTLGGAPVTVVTTDVDGYRRDSDATNSDDSTLREARAHADGSNAGNADAGDVGYTRQVLRFDMDTPTLYDTRGHALSISVVDASARSAETRTQL